MKVKKIIAVMLTAVLALSAAAGCSSSRSNQSSTQNMPAGAVKAQNEIAEKEFKIAMTEPVDEHETVFQINSIVDSGMKTDDGRKYIYLNVTIKNTSGVDYELSALNNFFLLMPDKTEVSFDIRTQIYAGKNFKGYTESPFVVAAGTEFTGYIGGFLLDENITDFTVCFFPTQDDARNKTSIIKCDVKAADMVAPPADFIG
ncbi:MAG TPA: hypothetical protein DCZ71_02540 [Ruminococcus sp.]|nr:hypothetical protein [Ruminococcus sp.]